MPTYKMIALTRSVEGRDDAYNDWYQNVHIPEIVALDGFTGAQRYKLGQHIQGEAQFPYAAIYTIEADDVGAVLGQFGAASASGKLTRSDAMDYASANMAIFEEFGPEVKA